MQPLTYSLVVFLMCEACFARASAPAPPPKEEPAGPRVIDFGPLPVLSSGRYHVKVKCDTSEKTYDETYNVDGRAGAVDVRDLAKASLEAAGWDVKTEGYAKLIVNGAKKKPVGKVTVDLEIPKDLEGVLTKENTPTERRVKDE
jgi:hypothetical protein